MPITVLLKVTRTSKLMLAGNEFYALIIVSMKNMLQCYILISHSSYCMLSAVWLCE